MVLGECVSAVESILSGKGAYAAEELRGKAIFGLQCMPGISKQEVEVIACSLLAGAFIHAASCKW